MSSVAYGVLNAQREAAPAGTSKDENSPGFGSYIDVVAALVPAEILAANAALLPLMTDSGTDKDGNAITTITDPGNLKLVFWLSIVFSILLYVAGNRAGAKKAAGNANPPPGQEVPAVPWRGWNWLRALIPAAAYVGWTMLQKVTAFDAIAPDMSEARRLVIAVFGAIFLGVAAKWLTDKADGETPPQPVPIASTRPKLATERS
jgi:hypothetical protein